MTSIEILDMHIKNTCSEPYIKLFEDMISTLELCRRCLDVDDFPSLREQILDVLER
jgi:hypothetical protein